VPVVYPLAHVGKHLAGRVTITGDLNILMSKFGKPPADASQIGPPYFFFSYLRALRRAARHEQRWLLSCVISRYMNSEGGTLVPPNRAPSPRLPRRPPLSRRGGRGAGGERGASVGGGAR